MKNGPRLKLFFLLLLYGTLQKYVSGYPEGCEKQEDVEPAKEYKDKPECWIASTKTLIGECNCGEAYVKDQFGRCTNCSEGFERNEMNNCVRCPSLNERWCLGLTKCICSINFRRNKDKICVPYRNQKKSDVHIATEYSTESVVLGTISVASLFGYLIHKCKSKYCNRN